MDRLDVMTRRELSLIYDMHPKLLGPYDQKWQAVNDADWWLLTWPKRKWLRLRRWWRYLGQK